MVEGTCLENKRAGNGTVGSNPTLSARLIWCYNRPSNFPVLAKGKEQPAVLQLNKIAIQGALATECDFGRRHGGKLGS